MKVESIPHPNSSASTVATYSVGSNALTISINETDFNFSINSFIALGWILTRMSLLTKAAYLSPMSCSIHLQSSKCPHFLLQKYDLAVEILLFLLKGSLIRPPHVLHLPLVPLLYLCFFARELLHHLLDFPLVLPADLLRLRQSPSSHVL